MLPKAENASPDVPNLAPSAVRLANRSPRLERASAVAKAPEGSCYDVLSTREAPQFSPRSDRPGPPGHDYTIQNDKEENATLYDTILAHHHVRERR